MELTEEEKVRREELKELFSSFDERKRVITLELKDLDFKISSLEEEKEVAEGLLWQVKRQLDLLIKKEKNLV